MTESYSPERYESLLRDIFTRFPSVQTGGFSEGAYKPGLARMEAFDALLGHPHRRYRTIHVAGTNGKGSVANMLASVLSAAGLKTGLYTSPHLFDFRERMRVATPDGVSLIPPEDVFAFLTEHRAAMDRLDLSFFEITTAMAFRWFADRKVDVAVIETGLGGRLDSTNIIRPDLALITSIGLDHCALLGGTLQAVAREKAGIFKEGVPSLVGEALPQTRPVFERHAAHLCPLSFAQDAAPSLWRRRRRILGGMDLRGACQEKNLRTVLAALDILKQDPFYHGLSDASRVEDALMHTAVRMDFHGRWERLLDDPPVIADIGHNPPALRENFAQLEAMRAAGEAGDLILVYGVMADKDLPSILPLMPEGAAYFLTAPSTPRALPASELGRRFRAFRKARGLPCTHVWVVEDVPGAVRAALALARSRKRDATGAPPLVYIGGSTFVVSEAAPLFGRFFETFPSP